MDRRAPCPPGTRRPGTSPAGRLRDENHALPAAHIIRVMLADLDSFEDMTPNESENSVEVARRLWLLSDFRLLID